MLIGQQFQCDVNGGHVCDVNGRPMTKIKLVMSCKNCSLFCYRSLTRHGFGAKHRLATAAMVASKTPPYNRNCLALCTRLPARFLGRSNQV